MSHREKLLKFHISYQLNTGHIKKILSKNNNNNNNKHNDINNVLKTWKQFGIRDPKEPFRYIVTNELIKLSSTSTTSDNITNDTATTNINNLTYNQQAPLHINLIMHHSLTATEHLFLTQVKDPVLLLRKVRKRGVEKTIGDSRQNINEALKALDENEARRITTIPPLPQSEISNIDEINITHDSSYTGGRYIKLSRECSQTPWVIKGKKLADISVSECIVDIFKKYHKCDDTKFVTAGREDANVRMLGTGRPFYCELVNPRRPILNQEEYHQMELEINSSPKSKDIVQVRQIQNISPDDTKIIKEGEEKKRKTYRALVWLSEPLTQDIIDKCNKAGESEFITYQKTPIRVFQRRGAAVREKTIHSLKMERAEKNTNSHFAVVYMNTQAGTYIKEFVHGDLGRTKPNLATIANVKYADLIELDVMEVDLQWPPLSS
ncbi:hypothetical protein BJ944DRAFT_160427 [Cunninghamella echinulata]|nr:hypothetical protein BJ944DRAFT_160427 [Cunninghamella echinulata]